MITLKADNRVLTQNSKYSYLTTNYVSGSSSIVVTNTEDLSVDGFILISDMGKADAEIFRVGSINTSSGLVTLQTAEGVNTTTRFAHPESTKVYALQYNQIRFYWTAATGSIDDENPTFDSNTPLSAWMPIETASFYTTYEDSNNSTGFGWFVFRNSVTTVASSNSNAIPYTGFVGNTVASVFADFDSLLNVNELKLVTINDKFSWLNEALAVLKNKLNLTNIEYLVSTEQTLNIIAGTAEYLLPADFSELVSIYDTSESTGMPIPFMRVSQINNITGTGPFYYLRNRYIGFAPTPAQSTTYKYRYRAKASAATSISTYIDLPDNAFYSLKDYMMYRACQKFNNPMAKMYYESFSNSVNLYMQAAVKRDANLDSWEPAAETNV